MVELTVWPKVEDVEVFVIALSVYVWVQSIESYVMSMCLSSRCIQEEVLLQF